MNNLVVTEKNVYRVDGLQNFKGIPQWGIPAFKGYFSELKEKSKKIEKQCVDVKIPKNFIQSTKDKEKVSQLIKTLFQLNEELQNGWNYIVYEDEDIMKLYEQDMSQPTSLAAYAKRAYDATNIIQANSFKADIFRYYYLYTRGGVWMDDKSVLRYSLDDPIFSLDKYDGFLVYDEAARHIEIAFLCTKAKTQLFKDLLEKCLTNIEKRFYGKECLEVTGPTMATRLIQENIPIIAKKDFLDYKGEKYKLFSSSISTVYHGNSLLWKQSAMHDINIQRIFEKNHYLQVWSDGRLYKDDNSNYRLNAFTFYSKFSYYIISFFLPLALCLTLYLMLYK